MNRNGLLAICACAGIVLAVSAAGADKASAPRAADGHPLLDGTWDNGSGIDFVRPEKKPDGSLCVAGCAPAAAPRAVAATPAAAPVGTARPTYRSEFLSKVKDLTARQIETDGVLHCHAPGVPRIGPPDQIVQGKTEIVFLYEDVSGQFFRVVTTDGRKHRTDLPPTPFGDAIGHWEGDTLVVETRNLSDDTWLTDNGAFHSGAMVVTERLRREGDTLVWDATVDDPKVLAEPWRLRPRLAKLSAPGLPEEVPCVEQDLDHVVDGTHHDNPR